MTSMLQQADALYREKRLPEAVAAAEAVLAAEPASAAGAWQLIALAHHDRGDLPAAVAAARAALAVRPDLPIAHNALGRCLYLAGDLSAARSHYEAAIRLQPDFALARANRAMLLLKQGDFRHGWLDYGCRRLAGLAAAPSIPRPQWDGSPLAGRGILVYTEQGLGDAIHFVRLLKLVKAQGGRVVFACQKAIQPLLKDVEGVDRWFPIDAPGAIDFDVHASLLDLPGLLGVGDRVPIPTSAGGYLRPDAERRARWADGLAAMPGLRVGLAWQGDRNYIDDRFRSVPPAALAPLADASGASFVRLQRLAPADADAPFPMTTFPEADADAAFVDTAAIIDGLDLVITSDTAVAHLAGALGKPTWVMLSVASEWRWLTGRDDSPWYPSMRLFRQRTLDDWAGVVADVRNALMAAVAGGGVAPPVVAVAPPLVPVAAGELADRLTILRLKAERFTDPAQVANVRRELELVEAVAREHLPATAAVERLVAELADVNRALWETEDALHALHAAGDFGTAFVARAREVVEANARRSAAKRRISQACGSTLVEEKAYGRSS